MLNKTVKKKCQLVFLSIFLSLAFTNASPAETYSKILELSGSGVTEAYRDLVAQSSTAPKAVGYRLMYSAPKDFPEVFDTDNIKGIGKYNSTTNSIDIYVNPNYESDPIGAGWIIQHEFVHGLTGYDINHSLSGDFGFIGTNGKIKESDSFDHGAAYQVNLVQLPNIVAEYLTAGQNSKALLAAAQFSAFKAHYLNVISLQESAVGNVGSAYTSNVISAMKNQTIKSGTNADGESVSIVKYNNVSIQAQKRANADGKYAIDLIVSSPSGSYFIRVYSTSPLSSSNLSAIADRFATKISDSQTLVATQLDTPDLDKLREKISVLLQPNLNRVNSSSTVSFYSPTSLGSQIFARTYLRGFLIGINKKDGKAESKTGTAIGQLVIDGEVVFDSRGPFEVDLMSESVDLTEYGQFDELNKLIDFDGEHLVPENYFDDFP